MKYCPRIGAIVAAIRVLIIKYQGRLLEIIHLVLPVDEIFDEVNEFDGTRIYAHGLLFYDLISLESHGCVITKCDMMSCTYSTASIV